MKSFYRRLINSMTNKAKNELSGKEKEQYNQIKSIWEESGKFSMPKIPDTEKSWLNLQRALRNLESTEQVHPGMADFVFGRRRKWAFAVSFIAIVLFISTIFMFKDSDQVIYSAKKMEQLSVELSDGSKIRLNAQTKVTVPDGFNEGYREVTLKGEAYFEVQKSEIPFIIHTNVGDVTVLGTKFNVQTRNDRMEVAVNEGIVRVTSRVADKDSSVILTAGMMNMSESGEYPGALHVIQFKQYPGWLYNKLTLQQTNLVEVLEEIERRFDVNIRLNAIEDSIKISGIFEASNLDSTMSSLCILIGKAYRNENGVITIY